jgi:hypothetical protein
MVYKKMMKCSMVDDFPCPYDEIPVYASRKTPEIIKVKVVGNNSSVETTLRMRSSRGRLVSFAEPVVTCCWVIPRKDRDLFYSPIDIAM